MICFAKVTIIIHITHKKSLISNTPTHTHTYITSHCCLSLSLYRSLSVSYHLHYSCQMACNLLTPVNGNNFQKPTPGAVSRRFFNPPQLLGQLQISNRSSHTVPNVERDGGEEGGSGSHLFCILCAVHDWRILLRARWFFGEGCNKAPNELSSLHVVTWATGRGDLWFGVQMHVVVPQWTHHTGAVHKYISHLHLGFPPTTPPWSIRKCIVPPTHRKPWEGRLCVCVFVCTHKKRKCIIAATTLTRCLCVCAQTTQPNNCGVGGGAVC